MGGLPSLDSHQGRITLTRRLEWAKGELKEACFVGVFFLFAYCGFCSFSV